MATVDERFRMIVENANEGISVVQEERVVFCNPRLEQMLGYSRSEIMERPFYEFVHPEDRGLVLGRHRRRLKGEKLPERYSFRVVTKSGETRWWRLNTVRITWEGRPATMNFMDDITEKVLMEEELRASRQRYQALVENINDVIYTLDEGGTITYISPAVERATKYSAGEILGRPFLDFVHPDDVPGLLESFQKTLQGELEPYEFRVMDKDGSIVYVMSSSRMARSRDGSTVITGVLTDITERKEAEKALLESERKYRELVDKALVGVYQTSVSGEFLFVNPALAKMFEFDSPQEMMAQGVLARYADPRDRGRLIHELTERGFVESFEVDLLTKNSNKRSVVLNAIMGPEGKISGMIVDVTEMKRANQRIMEERQRLEAILDSTPVPTFVVDNEHNVVFWNVSVENLTGQKRGGVLGRPLDLSPLYRGRKRRSLVELVLDMSDEELMEKLSDRGIKRSLHHPESFELEDSIWIGNNRRVVHIWATRLRDGDGTLLGGIQCAQDITERERLQQQLIHAQKMEALGTLAGGVAHEFNNILTAIQGYAQLLRMRLGEGSNSSEYLRRIEMGCQRASSLTRKVLTFSKGEMGKRMPLDANRLVDGISQMLQRTLPHRVRVERSLSKGLPLIEADPVQVEQILANLAINASDAMPEGGRILICTRLVEVDGDSCYEHPWMQPGTYVEISVEDEGEGIPEGIRDKIFEPFFTTKDPGKGTGLGLSIVYSMVKAHKGFIIAESPIHSDTKRGSRLRVLFPPVVPGEMEVSEKGEQNGRQIKQTSVLLVEEDDALREVELKALEPKGYKVVGSKDLEEGVALFQEALMDGSPFDVMVIGVPRDPEELERGFGEICGGDSKADVILCMNPGTSFDISEDIKKRLKGVLLKPFDLQDLVSILAR